MAQNRSLPRICIALGLPDVPALLDHARQEAEAGEVFLEFRLDFLRATQRNQVTAEKIEIGENKHFNSNLRLCASVVKVLFAVCGRQILPQMLTRLESDMANLTLVYGMRLLPSEDVAEVGQVLR